jgi:hypothetical protein
MKANLFFPGLFAAFFILYICCDSPNQISDSSSNKCTELAGSKSAPVTLGEILCISRDSSGVLYLVDKFQSDFRLFISKGNILYRKKVLGSSVFAEQYYFLSIEDSMQFVFHNHTSIWSEAYILKGNCKECDSLLSSHINRDAKNINDLDSGWIDICHFLQYERPNSVQLSITKEINNYELENFPPTTHIEYLAKQESGQYILVTRSYYDWNGDVVLHYGLINQMNKCQVTNFLRASDGGSTWITFKVGIKSYEAFFGVKWDTTGISNGKNWLRIDNDTLNLDRKSADIQTLNNLGFDCSVALR